MIALDELAAARKRTAAASAAPPASRKSRLATAAPEPSRIRSTPEQRRLDAGWQPPAALRAAIERREALRAAVDRLRPYRADPAPILKAIQDGDTDDIRLALCAHATGQWLDANAQRPDTDLTAWSGMLERRLLEAVWTNAAAVLESLPESADASYIREIAERASTPTGFTFDASGRPALPRMDPGLSLNKTMLSR